MRRTIDARIQQRQERQQQLKDTLSRLGDLLAHGLKRRQRRQARELLEILYTDISELVTAQNREWDAYANNHTSQVFRSLHWKIDTLEAEYANVRALITGFLHLEESLKRLAERIDAAGAGVEEKQQLDAARERLSTFRYSDFEARFRGDRESVREQLAGYIDFFPAGAKVLDLGCGRGEFVQMLQAAGRDAEGVDLSRTMLEEAEQRGLPCRRADIFAELKNRADHSLGGIFSAQVIEHIDPGLLHELVSQCRRVLKPGGVLVLETVNPLSLFALSRIFFLDATHVKPLHPEYMRFLLDSRGFCDIDIRYGPPPAGEALLEFAPDLPGAREFNSNVDRLNELLFGPSVYAVRGVCP